MPTDFGKSAVGIALAIDPGCDRREAKRGDYCGNNSTLHVCAKHGKLAALVSRIIEEYEKPYKSTRERERELRARK